MLVLIVSPEPNDIVEPGLFKVKFLRVWLPVVKTKVPLEPPVIFILEKLEPLIVPKVVEILPPIINVFPFNANIPDKSDNVP